MSAIFKKTSSTRKRPSFAVLIAALMLAEITCSLESNMIYVALSPLYATFGDPIRVGWLVTAFTLSSTASAAIGGRLGDIYGRRRVLLIMLAIGCFGSMLSAVADTLEVIIVGRIMQGATMAILPLCFGILRENVDEEGIGLGVSFLAATYAITVGVGMVVGGVIVDNMNWQGVFVVSGVVAAIAFVAAFVLIPPSPVPETRERLDWMGGLLFAPAVAAILYGLSEATRDSIWGLPLWLVLGGLLLLLVWGRHELRHPDPLLDLRLLMNRRIAIASGALFLAGVGPMTSSAALMPLLQQPLWTGVGFGLAATTAGMIKLISTGTSSFAIFTAGLLSKRIGAREVLLLSAMLSVIGWFGAALSMHILWLLIGLILFMIIPGSGLVFATVPRIIIADAPPHRTSEATGMSQVIRSLGLAIGAQTVAVCLAFDMIESADGAERFPSGEAYLLVYLLFGGISLVSFLLLLLLPKESQKTTKAAL